MNWHRTTTVTFTKLGASLAPLHAPKIYAHKPNPSN